MIFGFLIGFILVGLTVALYMQHPEGGRVWLDERKARRNAKGSFCGAPVPPVVVEAQERVEEGIGMARLETADGTGWERLERVDVDG